MVTTRTIIASILVTGISSMAALTPQKAPQIDASKIAKDKYVVTGSDGHLQLGGKRVRYWGWIGQFWLHDGLAKYEVKTSDSAEVRASKASKAHQVFDSLAQRIDNLGFNMVRCWNTCDWTAPYTLGDGSRSDHLAFALAALEKRGIKVWMCAFNDLGSATDADASLVKDTTTAGAWKAAVKEAGGSIELRGARAIAWDPRLQAAALRRMREIAAWPNHYKGGLRLGDDPQIGVWELSNEEWWFTAMANGHWLGIPKYFRDELQTRWCAWLKKKYGSDAELARAWKFLLPGESLEKSSVMVAPLASPVSHGSINDANPAAIAVLSAQKQSLTRDDFTAQRGADVIEFLVQLHIAYKTKFRDEARNMGRGLSLVPILLDTGEMYRLQSLYLHQQADASAVCTYIWQFAKDRQQPHFPFVSGLEELPRTGSDVPWAEVGRIPGKGFFMYETQCNNPSKYRAEYPYRMAALGAVQDMDIICWHLFGRPNDPAEATPYDKPMNYSTKGMEVEGVHYKNDEVESSALRIAGRMFTTGACMPVTTPTTLTFGKDYLYRAEGADYGKSFGDYGPQLNPTCYRYGLALKIDTSKTGVDVKGPLQLLAKNEACPIRPTSQISFDWSKWNLVFDAPSSVSYTGFFARNGGPVRFSNGVVLDSVVIVNPPSLPYPMSEQEKYVSLGIVADDGKPLAQSKKVTLSLMSTSFNTGFQLNEANVAKGEPYNGMVTSKQAPGQPPVLTARVGATVNMPMLKGMKYVFKDWHFRKIGEGTLTDGVLRFPADKPVFLVEMTR